MLASRILVAVGLWTLAALGSPLLRSEPNYGRRSVDTYGGNNDVLSVFSAYLKERAPPGTKRSEEDDAVAAIHSGMEQAIHGGHAKRDGSWDDLFNFIKSLVDKAVQSYVDFANLIIDSGILPGHVLDLLNGDKMYDINSSNNTNPRDPKQAIYPSKSPEDAPYSVSETTLRSAIHIPSDFEYGSNGKKPVIFVPGTAIQAGMTWHFAFKESFAEEEEDLGDPVWINIPDASLGDVQVNSEYVAYAINYISAICGSGNKTSQVTVLTFSQGGLNTQWALRYWPSTREVVEDFIAVSPGFGGTDLHVASCTPSLACLPAFKQQYSGSNLIQLLQKGDGRQAYVPTTTIYSDMDMIIQPQSGPDASAIIHPRRGVEVSNNLLQDVCPYQPAGEGIYTHELTLVNPVTWELIKDAMTNEGPGDTSRIDWLKLKVCTYFYAPALELDDVMGTQGLIVVAAANILSSDNNNSTKEPPIKAYAK